MPPAMAFAATAIALAGDPKRVLTIVDFKAASLGSPGFRRRPDAVGGFLHADPAGVGNKYGGRNKYGGHVKYQGSHADEPA